VMVSTAMLVSWLPFLVFSSSIDPAVQSSLQMRPSEQPTQTRSTEAFDAETAAMYACWL